MSNNAKSPETNKKVKLRKKPLGERNGNKNGMVWVLIITVSSFFLSVLLSMVSNSLLGGVSPCIALGIVFLIILMNIVFDIIGTAVTAADETPFHAMASRKKFGAKKAIYLIRNAHKVSNISNDVIGDICGIISGAATAFIVLNMLKNSRNAELISLIITGVVSAITVGGKSLGKAFAIRFSNDIVYKVGVLTAFMTEFMPWENRKRGRNVAKKNSPKSKK